MIVTEVKYAVWGRARAMGPIVGLTAKSRRVVCTVPGAGGGGMLGVEGGTFHGPRENTM